MRSYQRVCQELAGARKSETACVAELMKMYQKLVEINKTQKSPEHCSGLDLFSDT